MRSFLRSVSEGTELMLTGDKESKEPVRVKILDQEYLLRTEEDEGRVIKLLNPEILPSRSRPNNESPDLP